MDFQVRKHSKEEFYDTFLNWLVSQSFPLINKEVLPEVCFVLYSGEVPCYSVWVYFTSSKGLAWIAFPSSNKDVNYNKKQGGLTYLFNFVNDYLKKKKILTVFTTSGTENVIKALKESGFEEGDSNISHYVKPL